MNKILRNTILSLCLTSCLAMGMDDGDGGAVVEPATRPATATTDARLPTEELRRNAAVVPVEVVPGRWFGKAKFKGPNGDMQYQNTDNLLMAFGCALGQAGVLEKAVKEERQRTDVLAATNQILNNDLRGVTAQLAAAKEEGKSQTQRLQDLADRLAGTETALEKQRKATIDAMWISSTIERELALAKQKEEDLERRLTAANLENESRLRDLTARLEATERALEEQRRQAAAATETTSDVKQALALAAQREKTLEEQLLIARSAAEVRLQELRELSTTLTSTLSELASTRSAAGTNQRLVDMMREEAGVKEQLLGSLKERLLQFQRQLRVVVTSDHPVEDLDSARKFVVGEYQKEKDALERELAAQRGTLLQAREEHKRLTKQRGESTSSNLEELIAQAATRIQRLQADVETKERHLSTLTTEKTELEREIEALETKSVGDFIKAVRADKLLELKAFEQFSELARRGHNHRWAHGAGLSKGSQWLGEELVRKMGKDAALQLLTTGGLSREMAEWFISDDSQEAIRDHGKGTLVGTKAADEANWTKLKARFGVA